MKPWRWARIGQWSVWVLVVFVIATTLAVATRTESRAKRNGARLEQLHGDNDALQRTIEALQRQVRSLGGTPVPSPTLSSAPGERFVPVPGPQGPPGATGRDGRDGRDGAAGAGGAAGPSGQPSRPAVTTTTTIPRRCIVNPRLCLVEYR